MTRLYIFGLGSASAWDQAGWRAATALKTTFASRTDIQVDALGTPMNIFSHPVEPTDWLVFIDSMLGKAAPGTVQRFTPKTLPLSRPQLSSHGINLKSAVDLLIGMGFVAERIQIFAIEAPDQNLLMEERYLQNFLDRATTALHFEVKTWADEWAATRAT